MPFDLGAMFAIDNAILWRLLVAMILGMIIGVERLYAHKTASMRTYALVSMGSALFAIISELVANSFHTTFPEVNPLQIIAQIVTGIGFLGAGLIIYQKSRLTGITTASGIWVSAGIGIASGLGFFGIAIAATVLTLFIFTVLWFIEDRLKKMSFIAESDPEGDGEN